MHTNKMSCQVNMIHVVISVAGSLQQLSDSGYDSLKNEVNTDTEDTLKSVPLKDSRSMDSLISVSDCDLDCPDDELETDSSHSVVQIRNVPLAGDNVLLEQGFQQLKLVSGRDGAEQSKREKCDTPSSSSSLNSVDNGFSQSYDYLRSLKIFQSPQNFSPKSYWVRRHSADSQQPISMLNKNLHQSHHQTDSVLSKPGLHHKTSQSRSQSPPSYQHALLNLNRKPVCQTLTLMQSKDQPCKGRSLGNTQSSSEAPRTSKNTSSNKATGAGCDSTCMKSRTEEKVTLPESMFYGQSRKLTVHRVRGQNLTGNLSDALKVRNEEVMEKRADGRSCELRRCISSQWVGELGFNSGESYV